MATIYRLRIGKRLTNVVYCNEEDARVNAKQIAIDSGKTVSIWGAEEIEDVPYDLLNWTWVGTYGRLTWGMEEEEEEE